MVKNNDQDEKLNRRKVIKSIGGAGGAAMVGSLAAGQTVAQSKGPESVPETDIDVVKATFESNTLAQATAESTKIRPEIENLVDFIEKDSGLVGEPRNRGTITVQTDNEEFNAHEPAIDVIPFGTDTRKAKEVDQQSQRGNGLLFVYTVVEDEERVPVGTFGVTSRPLNDRGNPKESVNYQITSYILDDGEPTRAERRVEKEPRTASNEVSAQSSVVCYSCQTLVASVCTGGSRVLGQYGCVAACSAAFGANFIAIFGCASICSTMFTAISAVGCTAGGDVICSEMTDISPWYVSFC